MSMHRQEDPPALAAAITAQNRSADEPDMAADFMRIGYAAAEARIAALEAELETCRKYRDAYRQCDEIATADVRRLETERDKLLPWAVIGAVLFSSDDGSEIPEGLPMPDLTFDPLAALAETEDE